MRINLEEFSAYFKKHKESILQTYFSLLKIPSISTDDTHAKDCYRAALFVDHFLKDLSFHSEILEKDQRYLVYAEKIIDPSKPTLMFYGHTDVQPCDPLELWNSDPFSPKLENNNVFARGAQDNKGQLAYVLAAIKAFMDLRGSDLKFNIKFVIEGEEESGSKGTEEILKKLGDRLKCDELYIVDFDTKSESIPSLVLGMRGLCAFEIVIENSSSDLHSGMFGGVVYNPLRAISEMIASCFDKKGLIAIEGAYNGLKPLLQEDLNACDFSFDKEHIKKATGASSLCVPEGKKPREANWLLPTFEVNGLFGGYTQKGVKTVLPSKACAKISCRLGNGQDPDAFVTSCKIHLEKHLPTGFKMDFIVHQKSSSFYTSLQATSVKKARNALEQVMGHPCWVGLSGASVPIVGLLSKLATGDVALIGMGLDTDLIHAPNEHFSLSRFEKGFYMISHILESSNAV